MEPVTEKQRAALEVLWDKISWTNTLNLGESKTLIFMGMVEEGVEDEAKRFLIVPVNVHRLRESCGKNKIRIKQGVMQNQEELDSFYRKASIKLTNKIPSFGFIVEAIPQ